MQFRKASLHDMDEIKRIARSVIRHNYTSFLGIDAITSYIDNGMSDKEIEDGINDCIILENDGEIIAFAILKNNLLHLIMVDVPFQNAGYGGAMLAHIETELFSRYDRLCLQSFYENNAARRFYIKHGWQIAGQTEVPEMGLTMVQFEKLK